ncbi:similar to Saccharomyces cerevisiae YDR166C SEC5 Essential 107kDa subunit of the exocyst complex (Sec3p, Sec5p, Sec6p, Sec8p, Sec10p, Sec15p, Exo70p, and Exo84p) [Maudiozyma barnettii]|uniref:Exocyst complex component SEC5 n=1 Tax=Maudiozyma barnettii TaxID=61262 RepID=A0A8H2VHS5_9SACH|nr:exocyst subunit SEC5 [Kazachstania barnettii]CAB4255666.1 similar to Saccharomyces cerevisiae YDR166C SEC5 Essential 107kDa subunit of the exocyst complex [Kazachstania barnettii]CAD1784227.1 similar to Saccharomyces cerevisiae YDR166C SEC5 Essential 107kDa subunit of the exocyst complex (Sec3p, Sec5p, Sec6p, Sec8p, Sec10p, Sec15p, Exo70p, and Exo84p) [Kazachstania barnettii]
MSSLQLNEETLEDFYNLKTLDPQTSWEEDSNYVFNLSKWNNVVPDSDNSYDVLKDLIAQQKMFNEQKNSNASKVKSQDRLRDPLNNEYIANSLQQLNVKHETEIATYMINDKKFIVNKFLRDVHNKDTFEDLNQSLNNLNSIIEDQSHDLKTLVQDNFTSYVKIKNRLDKIYNQFAQNVTDNKEQDNNNLNIDQLGEKVDESIRATNMKLKPIMDTSTKMSNFKMAKQFIEDNRQFFDLPKTLKKYLEKKDFSSFIYNYSKGQEMIEKFKLYGNINSKTQSDKTNKTNTDSIGQSNKVPKVIELIWSQVESTIDSYRKETWEGLLTNSNSIKMESREIFLPMISKLLDLKEENNPILKWFDFYVDNFEQELNKMSNHLLVKIVEAQKRILHIGIDDADDIDGVNLSYYLSIGQLFKPIVYSNLKSDQREGSSNNIYDSYINNSTESVLDRSNDIPFKNNLTAYHGLTDTSIIVEMWLLILRYVKEFEDISNNFIQFWQHTENFLDGTYQNIIINDKKKDNILIGDNRTIDNFRRILTLSKEDANVIRTKGDNFTRSIFKKLLFFFQSSQASLSNFTTGDLSSSEVINSTKVEKDSGSPLDYGFVPPRANGLGCVRYLLLIFEPFLKFVTQLAQLGINTSTVDMARELVSLAIDRSIGAISSTKLRDVSNFYKLEDWEVYKSVTEEAGDLNSTDSIEYGVTQFPEIVLLVQQYSIQVIRSFLFSFEKLPIINGISIVNYPSKQILTGIEVQQIISMEAVLEAILKNAAKDKDNPRNSHTILTLTNLQYVREFTFPTILRYFDDSFEWSLSSKPLEIFNLLGKMESSIFGNYLSDLKITLRNVLEERFHEISWSNYSSNSFRVNDYIIEVLMVLINVHSECFRIGPQLINRIIKETQVFISRYLFESFKPFIGNLSSDGLLQVTVDIKFFEKVLGSYLEKDTEVTLNACLQNCFQNNLDRLERCISETEPIVDSNLERTRIQFAAFN